MGWCFGHEEGGECFCCLDDKKGGQWFHLIFSLHQTIGTNLFQHSHTERLCLGVLTQAGHQLGMLPGSLGAALAGS